METSTNYQQQAIDFAKKHSIKLTAISNDYKSYFADDKKKGIFRDVWKMKLSRNGKTYTFNFGQSIANSGQEPTMYDILTCLTKYDPNTFEDFCSEFGYDTDSRTAETIYKAVVKEFKAVERLFNDILEELQEIQ